MSAVKHYKWYKVEEVIYWQPNNMCIVSVNGKTLTLARQNNTFFAFAHKCPHASGIMAQGFLDAAGNVVCPLHRYRFHMQTGRNVSGEGYFLKTYPVETKDDGIYIGMEEQKFLGLF
ncbi:MAG: Rieske 2Fe-2S domain-containing protein [Sphingobacteriia bacterium]|nr:Rieske 2Fe-2S domain-containing protein [Sphingobacteriia bacterium]